MKRDDNFEEQDSGTLMTAWRNAAINDNVALQDQIEAELNSRGWEKEGDKGDINTWGNHRKD